MINESADDPKDYLRRRELCFRGLECTCYSAESYDVLLSGPQSPPVIDLVTDLWARRERLIATTRVLISGVAVLALTLDPSQPSEHAELVYTLLIGYLGYAVITAAHAWTDDAFKRRWAVTTHLIDIVTALAVVALTGGSTSPFFDLLLFPLVPATLRWRWRGTVLTAIWVGSAYVAIAIQEAVIFEDPYFALNAVLLRLPHFVLLSIVLASMAAAGDYSRRAIVNAAMWSPSGTLDEDEFHAGLVAHVAETLNAPRVVLWWRREDLDFVTVTVSDKVGVRTSTEDAEVWDSAVVPVLHDVHFLCARAHAVSPRVIYVSEGGLRSERGVPVAESFRTRFKPSSIASFRLQSPEGEGRLFVLDKARLTIDDVILGTFLAHQAENSLEHRDTLQHLRDAAVIEERARLARDVHDDVLQRLTALGLGLETVTRLIERAPERAREWVEGLQTRLSDDQRAIRRSIQVLKHPTSAPTMLTERLTKLASTLEYEWSLPVKLDVRLANDAVIPEALAREIRLIVQEAIINAARHAHCSSVYVSVVSSAAEVAITVDDDGRGFQFTGRYEDAERRRLGIGPVVITERVEAVGGTFAITSGSSGARLEIRIPLA
jgi:signal transduction histidine kinase